MDESPPSESGPSPKQFSWQDSYKTAQMVPLLDLACVGSYNIRRLVTNHANAIGCPHEYIFLPLLSCCAGLMGKKTKIKVNQVWHEPPVMWTMVGAYPGTRKTAALRLLMGPLLEIQRELEKQWHLSQPTCPGTSSLASSGPVKLIAGAMSREKLVQVLHKNGGQIICFVEDLNNFHKQLDVTMDCNDGQDQCSSLYDGMPLFSVQNGDITTLDVTCFNHTGMAPPKYVVDLFLNGKSWLSSRYLMACPYNPNFSTIWNSIPLSSDTPSFKTIFQTLHTYHQHNREYIFSSDAWKDLCRYHDEEWASMVNQLDHDERRRSTIEKSLGQIVRMAGVLKALNNACEFTMQASTPAVYEWDLTIDNETLRKAIELSKYFMEQKLALMLATGMSPLTISSTASLQTQFCSAPQQTNASHLSQPPQPPPPPSALSLLPPAPIPVSVPLITQPTPAALTATAQKEWEQPIIMHDDDYEIPFIPDFYIMDKASFITSHGRRVKRLLECFDDGTGVSATTAAQKSIAPPVKLQTTNNRHPVWVSVLFFKKVSEFGVGTAEKIKQPLNKKCYWRFKRKRLSDLDEKNKQMLLYLKVDMNLYGKIGPNLYQSASPCPPPPLDIVDNSEDNSLCTTQYETSFNVKQEMMQSSHEMSPSETNLLLKRSLSETKI